MKFQTGIVTTIPTAYLVELYQSLVEAEDTGDWESIEMIADNLHWFIQHYTNTPDSVSMRPSGHSVIDTDAHTGILTEDDGSDLKCAGGMDVSETCHCGGIIDRKTLRKCPYYMNTACSPDSCRIALAGGHTYIPGRLCDELTEDENGHVQFTAR